jgi:hypothetical protein
VVPRVGQARDGVVFDVQASTGEIAISAAGAPPLRVAGAQMSAGAFADGAKTLRYKPQNRRIEIVSESGQRIVLERPRPLRVSVGPGWAREAHLALLATLDAETTTEKPDLALAPIDDTLPALLLDRGEKAETRGLELAFDAAHPLLLDVPSALDWLGDGRLIAPDRGGRPVLSALRDGKVVGHLVVAREGVLEFAGDPFARPPLACAALLFDNSVGVLTGTRPSERGGFELMEGGPLPTRRQALAAPFESTPGPDGARARGMAEFGWLPALAAAIVLIGAGLIVLQRERRGHSRAVA